MSVGWVVTGIPSSVVEATTASRSATVSSEHTAKGVNPVDVFANHSRNVWDNRDNDGSNTNVRVASSRSITNRAASVLPVPQAIINWPRLAFSNPRTTAVTAWR